MKVGGVHTGTPPVSFLNSLHPGRLHRNLAAYLGC